MNSVIWVIRPAEAIRFCERGITESALVPSQQMNGLDEILVDSLLWVVADDGSRRCACVLGVSGVERYLEGYYKDDFIIRIDLTCSLLLVRELADASPLPQAIDFPKQWGLHQSNLQTTELLMKTIRGHIPVRLVPPDWGRRPTPARIYGEPTTRFYLEQVVAATVQSFSLNEMWTCPSIATASPVTAFALALLARSGNDPSSETLLREIDSIGPLSKLLDDNRLSIGNSEGAEKADSAWRVDLGLQTMDPAHVFARKFLGRPQPPLNREESLKKTQAAESLHQQVLRDAAALLIRSGITPLSSRSIDLAFDIGSRLVLIEIKTTRPENAYEQAAAGAFQVTYYKLAFRKVGVGAEIFVMISGETGEIQIESIRASLREMGVGLMLYTDNPAGPSKFCPSLHQLLTSTREATTGGTC